VVWKTDDYEERLDGLLAFVSDATGLPDGYLYLADESGLRFHLEQTRARPLDDPSRVAPGPMAQSLEGGAESIGPTPALELVRTAEHEHEGEVATVAGPMYSLPLALDGELVGIIQTGPLPRGGISRGGRHKLDELSSPLAAAVRQARGEQVLRQRLQTISAQLETGQKLAGSALDVGRFVQLLLELGLRATRTEAGFVAIVDPDSGSLEIRAEANLPDGFAERLDLSPDRGLFDWAPASETGALVLRDLEAADRLGIRSVLAVPLLEGQEPLGVVALLNFGAESALSGQSLELLETFAEQIRLMLHNSRLFDAFTERYLETVKGLAQSLDVRRPYTHAHHERVTEAATTLAGALGVSPAELDAISTAAAIHDVGMAAVAELEGGYEADTEHPAVGASMIESLPLHPWAAASVATHHEWFDGWGFPKGVKGEEIPLGGRILAAAEFLVERATTDPVGPGLQVEELVTEVEQRRGSQLDPHVADAALELLRGGRLDLGQNVNGNTRG